MRIRRLLAVLSVIAVGLIPDPAAAIPAFARKYNASCSLCHSTVPRLNAFGEDFAANGFEMVIGEEPAASGFFWLVGQGGSGIMSSPGYGALVASQVLGEPMPEALAEAGVDPSTTSPSRFRAA